MVKFITLLTKIILVALCSVLFASCNNISKMNSISGSGNVTTETRTVTEPFKNIKVSNAIDLVIEQADVTEIIVEADDNLQSIITTKVENGVLIIKSNSSSFRNATSKKVTVKMPIIEDLDASSASTISGKNMIKGENISLNTSSAANINLKIESDNIYCDSSSGSEIIISGKALKLDTSSSSGSSIHAEDLLVNEVIADASSGSSINVHPIVSLNAEASSGASISYNIEPKTIQKRSNSGGSVDRE